MNHFSIHLKFNTPADLSGELAGHSVMVLQSVSLADGSSKGQLTLTANGSKFVISSLSARKVTSKLGLRISREDGEVMLSCSQGSNLIVSGFIEEDSCCGDHDDHDHEDGCCAHEHEHESVSASEQDDEEEEVESLAESDSAAEEEEGIIEEDSADDEEADSMFEDLSEYEEGDLENIEEDDEEDDDEEDEEDEEQDDEDDEEDEDEEEEEEPVKKVTFNAKEQGPHLATGKVEPTKPAIKQQPQQKQPQQQPQQLQQPRKPESRVGTTVTLKGGLKYTILKEGTGPVVTNGRRVNVRYVGCLASNGKRFDKGQIRFVLGRGEVIKGWDMGVDGMRVKEARRILIPAHLGYGSRGAPPAIPGNAALAFEVELLDF